MNHRDRPVNIRRNIESYGDPYLDDLKPDEAAVCRECRSVYSNGRWELEKNSKREPEMGKKLVLTLCPACQKIRDRLPGGIVTVTGDFAKRHEEEIINLMKHINQRSMEGNPLERIMDIERSDSGMVVLTTNEKLAQKFGRALYKAYSGEVEYKWSEDTKLARVNWHRG